MATSPPTSPPTSPSTRSRARSVPPTLVLFVRHGTTPTTGQVLPGRAPGLHLAESGREQAEAVADRLAGWSSRPAGPGSPASTRRAAARPAGVVAVYASPLERTRETAKPIAARLGLRVVPERGLLECDFGEWTGCSLKELAKLPEWTTVQRYPSGFRFPSGESFTAMQARMTDTVARLCARHPGEAIVAVSHADPIKAAVADAMGTHLDLFQRVVISPCSVTAVSYGPSGPSVLGVNSTRSLDELRPS